MRDIFSDYYRPTKEEYNHLWDTGFFVVDANVYLNLYRYSRETREELLRLFHTLRGRLWCPHQVAAEFLKRRITVIHQQHQKMKEVRDHLAEVKANVEKQVHTIHRDPPVEPKELLEKLVAAFSELEEYLNKQEDNFFPLGSNAIEDDEVWTAVEDLLDGKVGPAYDEKRLKEIEAEGEQRTENDVPPGFKDEGHGDLILWLQTIDKAKETERPIILVTDDRKDDWWWKEHNRTIGPRRELVEEMRRESGNPFHMYTPDRFMKFAADYFDEDVSDEAISEAENFVILERSAKSQEENYLTEQELEVLKAFAQGMSNKQIAKRLHMPEHAVRYHASNIYEKLHVYDRTQAVVYAIKNGLLDLELLDSSVDEPQIVSWWDRIMHYMKGNRQAAAAVYEEATIEHVSDNSLVLAFPRELSIYAKLGSDQRHIDALKEALDSIHGWQPNEIVFRVLDF